jgi:hypothetical protein
MFFGQNPLSNFFFLHEDLVFEKDSFTSSNRIVVESSYSLFSFFAGNYNRREITFFGMLLGYSSKTCHIDNIF